MKVVATTLAGPGAHAAIGDALRSAANIADENLIIMAGCDVDLTLPVIRQFAHDCGRTYALQDLSFPRTELGNPDFSKARNFALEQAELLGADWALTLDVDERLEIPQAELKWLGEPGIDAFAVHDRDRFYQKPRFIRCGAGARWKYPMHERLVTTGTQGGMDGTFWELHKTETGDRARFERGIAESLSLLEHEEIPEIRRHLAECLISRGDIDGAKENFSRVLANATAPFWEKTWCRYRLAGFMTEAGDYAGAREFAASALAQDPGFFQELSWVLAHCSAKLHDYTAAALWASYALNAPIDMSRAGHRDPMWKTGCEHLLSRIQAAAEGKDQRMTTEHFLSRDEFRPDYAILARSLVEALSPFSVHLDLGAGNGLLVEAMQAVGKVSIGIEQSTEAEAATPEAVRDDIAFGLGIEQWASPKSAQVDLVTCVETLEHVPAEQADFAVSQICARSSEWIYFSAAQPGQGGIGHVNEQPKEYWRAKFEANGFEFVHGLTESVAQALHAAKRCWWLERNAQIFQRSGAEG